ncbi:hypothetical protein D3C86_1054110 [compost metagenome]
MLGTRLHRSDPLQHLRAVMTGGGFQFGQRGLAECQRAGLVKRHHIDVAQGLQGVALTEQHAHFSRAARAHHDGRGRGQPHGARAGDDQHGHCIDQRVRQGGRGAEEEPDTKREQGGRHHGGHEPGGDLVHQRLDGQPRALGRFHHADDAGQHCVGAGMGHAQREAARGVQGAAGGLHAGLFFNRHGLAGQHGLVDVRTAFDDVAVQRDFFAGAHQHDIARVDLFNLDIHGLAVAHHARRARLQADQALDGRARLALGARFQCAPQQDQGDDDGGGFKVDVACGLGQPGGRKGGHYRIPPGGARAQGHQRIHLGRAPP